jgi:glycine cleavage system H protein
MPSDTERRFSESHEWFSVQDDGVVTVGITPYAANELTDITYVEMKPIGTTVNPGDSLGEIESVKTTSDVFAAVGGEIVEVNEDLNNNPALVNTDPYGAGWLVKLKASDIEPVRKLMDQASYDRQNPID